MEWWETIKNIWAVIVDWPWETYWRYFRAVILVADGVLLIVFIYICVRALEFKPKFLTSDEARRIIRAKHGEFREKWQRVLSKVYSGRTEARLLAIIEADKIADDVLKNMGFRGEHMADRLMQINSGELQSLEKLWRAHKIRNDLVHTPGFEMSESQAIEVLRNYRDFLEEVKAI